MRPLNCPRCGKPFICHEEDPEHCQCAQITLNDEDRTKLKQLYTDCLCIDCLRALKETWHKKPVD